MSYEEFDKIRKREIRKIIKLLQNYPCIKYIVFAIGFVLASEIYIAVVTANEIAFGGDPDFSVHWFKRIVNQLTMLYTIIYIAGIYLALSYPVEKKEIEEQFRKIGLHNKMNEVPYLIHKSPKCNEDNVTFWQFRSTSIPLQEWLDRIAEIEVALNVTVIKIRYLIDKTIIEMQTVPAQDSLPKMIKWNDSSLWDNDYQFSLGRGYLGEVSINLNSIPHVLIGGSTGSGKSVLLKLILMQAIKSNSIVYISDFKGGVDYSPIWHKKCKICIDEIELLNVLSGIINELEKRKVLFREAGYPEIEEYNLMTKSQLKRIFFACDEVAEILDRTGADADRKKLLNQIENKLSIIARQGRAFGMHLLLATQRPDATIIPGQIRNNLDCRICGRADNVLSQIILDSTMAADQIPKDSQGLFMMNDGTLFQAYWFDEDEL